MNNNHKKIPTLEESLSMYAETVSPSQDILKNILNQIPEKENKRNIERRAIRSPYRWLPLFQCVSVFVIMFAFTPFVSTPYSYMNDPFYKIDIEVNNFENNMYTDDYTHVLNTY